MKISQEHAILITNVYLSKQYDAQGLLNELADRSWKLGIIDSLLKRIHKTGKIVWQPVSSRPPSSRKGVFIATKLNSTDPVEQRTAKSVVFLFITSQPTN